MAGHWTQELLAEGPLSPKQARIYRSVLIVAILASTNAAALGTVPDLPAAALFWIGAVSLLANLAIIVDYLLRLILAWQGTGKDDSARWKGLRHYMFSAFGLFDLAAALTLGRGLIPADTQDAAIVLSIFCFLKLARYSPALETLRTVILIEAKPLMSALFIVLLLAYIAATSLFFVERHVNSAMTTLPDALWWAVITLTTVGYGDVVPITPLGKFFGTAVAILGLCMFALPASILASGFTEEMRRHAFIKNWSLVSKVPFFNCLNAGQIAEIAELLRPYTAIKGEAVIREGEIGESMYFIVTGEFEGRVGGTKFILKAGEFFGEIALLDRSPRMATVKALMRSQLLTLGVRDFQKFVGSSPELMPMIRKMAEERLGRQS
jgi:voltage-gated potassium channel